MIIHKLKINKEFADAVYNGSKKAEVRRNDRRYRVGDHIEFSTVDNLLPIEHPINGTTWKITHVLGEPWSIPGHVILSIGLAGPMK